MAVAIEISESTYDRLRRHAVPFEDTPESVIVRLLEERSSGGQHHQPDDNGERDLVAPDQGPHPDIVIENPARPPSLRHTKVTRAEVDGSEVVKPNWTKIRQALVTKAARTDHGYSLHQLLAVCPVNAVEGVKTDEGYTFYETLGISIQGQDANHAWQAAATVAKALGVSVEVCFQWRTKPDAAYPGKWARLAIE